MRDLVFGLAWILALPLVFVSASSGILLWIWVALLSPNELLYGMLTTVPFNKLVAIITIFSVIISKEKKDFYVDSLVGLLLAYLAVATMSWLLAVAPSEATTELYLKLVKVLVLAFLICAVMTTRHRMHMLVVTLVLSLAFLAVKEGLIALLTAGGHKIIGTGGIGDNNSLAAALLMVVPLSLYLVRYSAVRLARLGMAAVMGLSIVTVVMTFSRGGIVGLGTLSLFTLKNSRNKFLIVILILAGAAMIYGFAPEKLFSRLSEDVASDDSFMGRVVAWKISFLMALDYPLFGAGPHAVQVPSIWVQYHRLLPMLDFIPTPPVGLRARAAHSIYFEVIGDYGFLGFGLFMAILFVSLWKCYRIYKRCAFHPTLVWAADLARMLQISIVVYMVACAALSMAYFEMFWVIVALVSRCDRTVTQALAAEAPPTEEAVQRSRLPDPLWAPAPGRYSRPALPQRNTARTLPR